MQTKTLKSDNIKHVESHVNIYFSGDYGMFKFLKGNRDISEARVKKIKKAIDEGVDMLKYAPIIVNGNMEIMDGQHRFCVAKELGRPVHYVINRNMALDSVPSINSKSKNWGFKDYLNSYVDLKKETYIELQQFLNEFEGMSLNVAFKIFHDGHPNSKEAADYFRDGLLKNDGKEHAIKICGMLKDFVPYCASPYNRRMITVMTLLEANDKYDHKLMVKKFEQSGAQLLNIHHNSKEILAEMEAVINYRSKKRILIH